MTRADYYMEEMINRIQKNGFKDVDPRPKYADGTPAHTISVNHTFRSYDLSAGDFPICTLRPQAWKTGIREIFTIYQKPTNDIATMHDMGVTWWDEWDIGDGTIGQRYGATVSRYDLINNLIKDIQNDPYGRRKIVSLWQEQDLHETPGLAPCAFLTIHKFFCNILLAGSLSLLRLYIFQNMLIRHILCIDSKNRKQCDKDGCKIFFHTYIESINFTLNNPPKLHVPDSNLQLWQPYALHQTRKPRQNICKYTHFYANILVNRTLLY